jgi:agmatinase
MCIRDSIEIASASTLPKVLEEIKQYPLYITLDVDVLDPSLMMGTGTPEAGGLTYKELLSALLSMQGLNIVGADIVELAPDYDHSGVSTATTCTLIREMLLLLS